MRNKTGTEHLAEAIVVVEVVCFSAMVFELFSLNAPTLTTSMDHNSTMMTRPLMLKTEGYKIRSLLLLSFLLPGFFLRFLFCCLYVIFLFFRLEDFY